MADYNPNPNYNSGGYEPPVSPPPEGSYAYTANQLPRESYPPYQYTNPEPTNNLYSGSPQVVPQKPKRNRAGLKVASVLLACTLCGFGGGMLAMNASGHGTSVVYRAPQDDATPVGTAGDSLSVRDAAAKALDSVVSIETSIPTGQAQGDATGAGSGVIITEDGYILTNHHVIEGASSVLVTLPDGTEVEASVVASDAESDIAVLKVDVTGLIPAVLADSDALVVGDFCLAVGNPMGTLGGSVTDGIISATDRDITIGGYSMSLLQMSAAVSPGNSGGGLFNSAGELVGIVNAKSGSTGSEGLGFAIPINHAMEIAQQLIENGYIAGRPALGVSVAQVGAQQAAMAGLPGAGVYIQEVEAGGAAQLAGLQPGDKLVKVGNTEIEELADLSAALENHTAGDTLTAQVQRGEDVLDVEIELQEKTA